MYQDEVPVFIPSSSYDLLIHIRENSTLNDFQALGDEALSLLIQAAEAMEKGGMIGALEPLSKKFQPLELNSLGQASDPEDVVSCIVQLECDERAWEKITRSIRSTGLADLAEFCLVSLCFMAWIVYIKEHEHREPVAYYPASAEVQLLTLWDLRSLFRLN